MPYRDSKQRYQDKIVQMREYHRNRYAENAKKNRGDGECRQLQYYNDRKDIILRQSTLMNAWENNSMPFKSTMKKHSITDEEVKMRLSLRTMIFIFNLTAEITKSRTRFRFGRQNSSLESIVPRPFRLKLSINLLKGCRCDSPRRILLK